LFVGKRAAEWASRLEDFSGVDAVSARLPAEAIRSFEHMPPDVVVFVTSGADRRLAGVVSAIRSRPLGTVTPLVVIGPRDTSNDELEENVDAWLGASVEKRALLDTFATQLELDPTELARPEFPTPRRIATVKPTEPPDLDTPIDATEVETKLQQVRHQSYFAILEVEPQASAAAIRDAFETLRRRFSREKVPDDVARRFPAELDEIRDAVEDAWAVLGNETLRRQYAEAALTH
jgi:hypothetical protein